MLQAGFESYRTQIQILTVDRDEAMAQALANEVKRFGYVDVSASAAGGSISHVMGDPPQILICDFNAPSEIEDYLMTIRDASPQTLVIVLARADQALRAYELVAKGLAYDSAVRPLVSPLELSQKVDRATAQIAARLETAKLRDSFARPSAGDDLTLNDYLAQLARTNETGGTTQIFIDALSREWAGVPVLYFKYLPSHASLPLAQAAGAHQADKYRGLGLDLRREGPAQLEAFFENPAATETLRRFIKELFAVDQFTALTHFNEGEPIGLFVILKKEAAAELADAHSRPLALLRIFEIAFKKNLALKEKHALDTTDPLTGLVNRRHFAQRLEDELSRARRILMPMSVITLDCDRFHQINERVGRQQADSILKAIALILKKTTRVSDVIARTGPDEFTILLPHTGQTGAAVKAERLRRLIASTKFPLLGPEAGTVTVSCGVSEYPSLSADAESIVRAADDAIAQVKNVGNKVCLATPPAGLEMDFVPR